MKGKNITLFVIIGIVLILLAWGCGGYNGLVKEEENVKKEWSNVETAYQNRADLVDNLVATVKGAADFEQKTLTDVVEARAKATSVNVNADNLTPEKIAEFQNAQGQLTGALSRLLVTVEAYPTLRATENFSRLQAQLEGIENGILVSRRSFNEAVNSYNVKLRSFPMNIFGAMFGFSKKEGFKAEEGAEKAPKVDFNK